MDTTVSRIIPEPFGGEGDTLRYVHSDLDSLSREACWAEHVLLSRELATRVFERRRPRLIDAQRGVTDIGWMRQRVQRLRQRLGAAV